jgi:hypothetical protein
MSTTPRDRPLEREPVVLFARLDVALARGELQRAAAAQRELAELGWDIRFAPPCTPLTTLNQANK